MFLLSLAFSLIVASVLGKGVLLLCLIDVALVCLLGVFDMAGEREAGALLLGAQTFLAWLIGRAVTPSPIQPLTIALAALFGASLWGLITGIARRAGNRFAILHGAQWLIATILVVAHRPVGAGVILVEWVGCLLLQIPTPEAGTYIRYARWLLATGMIAAAAATMGLG